MKSQYLQLLTVTICLILLTGCNDRMLEEIMKRKGLAKKAVLKEMVRDGRQYNFFYDKKGLVDYIEAQQDGHLMYTYEITYDKKKLSSAALVEDGEVVSENHNFMFDKKGNITSFTYTWYIEDVPGGVSTVYDLEYDQQNRLVAVNADGASQGSVYTYDNRDNVTRWTTPGTETTYTYDDKLNPLNRIPDLIFLFVEEHFIWEFALSEQNSLTRSPFTEFNMQTTNTTYTNEYDEYYRLVRKVDESGSEFTFTYY